MKKTAIIFLIAATFFLLTSCVSTGSSEPLVGVWKTKINDDIVQTFYFTADGKYVKEVAYNGIKNVNCEFGNYTTTEFVLETDTEWFSYRLVAHDELMLDNHKYRKVSSKAENNSGYITGVWANDYERLGFTRDGYAIAMGYYYNFADYKAENSVFTAKGRDSEYLIVNSNLYIRNFGFIGETEGVQKYTRLTSGGVDTSAESLLTTKNIIFTNDGNSGSYLNCYRNGVVVVKDFLDLKVIYSFKGLFNYKDHIITTSDGRHFAYACVDGELIGYTYDVE